MDDLLLGERPWRLRAAVTRRPFHRARFAVALLLVLLALLPLTPPVLALAAAAAAAALTVSVDVWAEGGGRHPLGSRDLTHWLAHDDLTRIEREEAARRRRSS